MKTGIVLCSRRQSSRIKNKPFQEINGRSIIHHLLDRLVKSDVPIYLAVPHEDAAFYAPLCSIYPKVNLFTGDGADPLARTLFCAINHKLDAVIRVTHDKIFVDLDEIPHALEHIAAGADYVYSPNFIPGSGFEVFTKEALVEAATKYSNVEHLSYAIRAVSKTTHKLEKTNPLPGARLLIDYPADIELMEVIMSSLGNSASLTEVIEFLSNNPWLMSHNRIPLVTVYTCMYNAAPYVRAAIQSVYHQVGADFEYIMLDDHSTDGGPLIMARAKHDFMESQSRLSQRFSEDNVRLYRSSRNVGLASLSKKALEMARGRWIIRLDADDVFTDDQAIANLVLHAETNDLEAVYPAYYHGDVDDVRQGDEKHHAGGTLFNTMAIRNVDFRDGLRGHEGHDLFLRASKQLKIGYYKDPIFLYRQRGDSLSKTNLTEREKTLAYIEKKYQESAGV